MGHDRLKVVLFALTGFGNPVLQALINDSRVSLEAVFTVKYDQPFPYYPERQLIDLCREQEITCYHGVKVSSEEGVKLLLNHAPELILIATFKQLIKENVLKLPPSGVVNFHPSLLPLYRGPCPSNMALVMGEKVTGVTAHYVTEGLDDGDILLQRSVIIDEEEFDGSLRRKLAHLSGEMVPELIGLFSQNRHPSGVPQDHRLASQAPKPLPEDGYVDISSDFEMIRRKIRAYNPIPGTSITIGDQRILVDKFALFDDNRANGVYENKDAIDVINNSQLLRLYKKIH